MTHLRWFGTTPKKLAQSQTSLNPVKQFWELKGADPEAMAEKTKSVQNYLKKQTEMRAKRFEAMK